jgi:uncharacterized repeat protein (TIGR01451 family)
MATTLHHRLALLASLTVLGAVSLTTPAPASAAPELREQMDLKGNFVLLGATLAHECASGLPNPIAGLIGACPDNNVAAPDIYWRADDPSAGMARADESITSDQARATAVLVLPDGAEVAYARLYWGGLQTTNMPDTSVTLERPEAMFEMAVTADDSVALAQDGTNAFFYQSTADVTELVKAQGPGAFRVSGVASTLDNAPLGAVAAWYMVVFYEKATEPSRNLAIFDSLEYVDSGIGSMVSLSGFVVPPAAFDATLGVVAYEGENQFTGDELSFNGMALSNAINPADNFFNATRSFKGMAVSNMGDLPRLSGAPLSYSNLDMDVVDVTARVDGGDTSATIEASSTLDIFVLSAFITSISTLLPDFTPTTKKVVDVNGGVAAPGDVLEYQIIALNDGSDASIGTLLRDPLPMGVSFVPGSINVFSGPNMGMKTDAAADDQADFDAATRTLTVRLGTGATATAGGKLAIGEMTEVRFQVTIDAATRGDLTNQGFIVAAGEQGAAEAETATDADTAVDGQGPTTIFVEECEDDMQCMEPTPHCDPARMPRECVECATGVHCNDTPDFPDCDSATGTCVCEMGAGNCNDTDMDDISDGAEDELGTDPMDADTDDDGVLDGAERGPDQDTDGDGLINALDSDADNDGLPDGLEMGLACDHPDTDRSRGRCIPDGDAGATTTDPLLRDTDGGGATDGSEDFDLDGVIDGGQTDPTAGHGADDVNVVDMDSDGLSDPLEGTINSDPLDADTDDDGLGDGREPNPTLDDDQDGANSVLDVDSDNDALFDGTETGYACDGGATDATKGHCRGDADLGATKTSPIDADTDDGGIRDGGEDLNWNGVVDGGETDPTAGNGDDDAGADADMDGLNDALEDALGTDPGDADSDDDGLRDGDEANPSDDADGDGLNNARDPDSDGDGLWDGTELGKDCSDAATDGSKAQCTPDRDPASVTSPVLPDTDFGGIDDGKEDFGKDGAVDANETNPKDGSDDAECEVDMDCGGADSGKICVEGACAPGCRGMDGNGCAEGERCTSVDGMAGMCVPFETTLFGGGGCKCGVSAMRREDLPTLLLVLAALLIPAFIRKRR